MRNFDDDRLIRKKAGGEFYVVEIYKCGRKETVLEHQNRNNAYVGCLLSATL